MNKFQQITKVSNTLFKLILLLALAFFSWLMFVIVAKYWPLNRYSNFLMIKQTEINEVPFYLPIFYIHVFTAGFSLLAGFTQFSPWLLQQHKKLHKIFGYIYVVSVLVLAAPSGFFIGFFANGGIVSKIAFITLSILWFLFTIKGLLYILKGKIITHKKYFILSYSLCTSALTLRLWKVLLVYLFHPAPMDLYKLIAWLGWIPNFIIAIFIILNKKPTNEKFI